MWPGLLTWVSEALLRVGVGHGRVVASARLDQPGDVHWKYYTDIDIVMNVKCGEVDNNNKSATSCGA